MLCLSLPTPGFPPFYCILGANLGVTFAWRCFRDDCALVQIISDDAEKEHKD